MPVYPALVCMNGNVLAGVDVETTGDRPGYHEVIQVGIVLLDSDIKPMGKPFYKKIKPEYPERADPKAMSVHGLNMDDLLLYARTQEDVAEELTAWVQGLELPQGRKLTPLAHNWVFEHGFLNAWLGPDLFASIFHYHPRDSMLLALSLNDTACMSGEPAPFNSVSLPNLCKRFSIVNSCPHDALCDALAGAELYRHLLKVDPTLGCRL